MVIRHWLHDIVYKLLTGNPRFRATCSARRRRTGFSYSTHAACVDALEERLLLSSVIPAAADTVAPVYQTPGTSDQTVSIHFTLTGREAAFDNELGIVRVDDALGRIGAFNPSDAGYAQAAFASNRMQVVFPQRTAVGATINVNLPGGANFMLFGIQNSSAAVHTSVNSGNSIGRFAPAFFGIDAANPDGATTHFRTFSSGVIGFEDLTFGGDRDFNDLEVKFQFPLGSSSSPPTVTVQLVNDTGTSGSDLLTSDPVVRGTASGVNPIDTLEAAFDTGGTLVYHDVTSRLLNGTYILTSSDLATVRGSALTDGHYKLHVRARDTAGQVSSDAVLNFTLDTTTSAATVRVGAEDGDSPTYVDVTYNEPMGPGAFTVGAYTLTIVGGAQDGETIPIASVEQLAPNAARLHLVDPLETENYVVTIGSAAQPAAQQLASRASVRPFAATNVTDLAGNPIAIPGGGLSFTATSKTPPSLYIATTIATTTAGANLGPISVRVLNSNGVLSHADDNGEVTLFVSHNAGADDDGAKFLNDQNQKVDTLTAKVQNGVATFANVRLTEAGVGYILTAEASDVSQAKSADSNRFIIKAAAATKIVFQNQPTLAIINQTINSGGRIPPFQSTGVTVQVEDQFNNAVLDSTATVKITLKANSAGGTLTGPPDPGIVAVNGLAVFTSLSLDKAGSGYTLEAAAPGLGTVVTDSFSVLAAAPVLKFLNASGAPTTDPIGSGPFAVGARLPTIVVDADGLAGQQVILGPPGRLFGETIVTAAFDAQLNKTVAKFTNVFIGKGTAGEQLSLQARFLTLPFAVADSSPPISLAAGQATKLLISGGGEIKTDTAGTSLQLKAGGAIQVFVQDIYGNTVTTGPASTAEIWIGVNRAKPNSLTTPIGDHDDPTSASFGTYVKVKAVAGVATFPNLFINRASTDYQLAVGSPDFGLNSDTSKPFNVTIGAPAQVNFLVEPDSAERGAFQRITGKGNQVIVAIQDRVGNVVTADSGRNITMILAANGDPGKAELKGRTTVADQNGVAVFDLMYITDKNDTPIPGFKLQAKSAGLPDSPISGAFTLAGSPGGIGRTIPLPIFTAVTTQGTVAVNQPLSFSYTVSAPNTPANAYDNALNVLLQLVNADGTSATGVFIGSSDKKSKTSVDGKIQFGDGLVITQPGTYRIRALLDVLPQNLPDGEIISAPFTVTAAAPAVASAVSPAASGPALGGSGNPKTTVGLDLASFTEDFDFIKAFPAYNFLPTGADQPLTQQFQPPSLPLASGATTAPPMQQPNTTVASVLDSEHFTQVPQSTKWWSSLMFPRTTVDNAPEVPQDSKGNQLYPMFADPLAAMVNSASTFAGLGLAYPTHPFVVPAGDTVGGDPGLPDMRNPGNVQYLYKYNSASDQRAYQDFSIGLKDLTGAKADATILSYTDNTVTLDWNHQLQATMGEGLPFVYFQTKNIAGTTTMQLVTRTDKPVTIKAFNSAGQQVTSGDGTDGAIRLEISYSVSDKAFPGGNEDVTITVRNNYGLFLPKGVAWNLNGGALTAQLTPSDATKNYFSVAILPDVPTDITGDAATEAFLNQAFQFYGARAYSFVTGSTSGFSFDEKSGKVTTSFEVQTTAKATGAGLKDNSPLQALYPNQWLALYPDSSGFATDPNTTYTYRVARGTLKVWDGAIFATQLQYRGALPLVPPVPEDGTSHADLWNNQLLPYLVSISSQSTFDGSLTLDQLIPYGQNNYLDFQSMLGAAQLIPILVEVSESQDAGLTDADRELALESAQKIFSIVEGTLGAWLSAKDDQALQLLYYQPHELLETNAPDGIGWQALLSETPGFLSSESLNDQNLIYGYLIKTASIINMYDSQWANTRTAVDNLGTVTTFAGKYGEIINRIVDNVANYDRTNTDFPFLRNFDVSQGHSWADGAANGLLGTNMESSSEAINFDSALIQWGEATGNQYLRDLGVSLYTNEVASVNLYYFNNPGPFFKIKPGTVTNAFPTEFTTNPTAPGGDNRPSITILHNASMGISGGFVGDIPAAQVGIQLVPLTGASLYLGSNTAFVKANADFATSNLTQEGGIPVKPSAYLSVIDPYLAFLNGTYKGKTALQTYKDDLAKVVPINRGVPIDTVSFNMHWLEAFAAYGQVDTSVTADTVSYGVFIKTPGSAGTRTYLAYNPEMTEHKVTFSDGFSMTVPGHTTLVASQTNKEVATQTFPDFSIQTPTSRFFLSSAKNQASGNYTFLSGQTGTGEQSVNIPQPAAVTATIAPSPTGVTSVANGASSIVTVTTTAAHGFFVGQTVQISGVGVADYNGTFVIASVLSPTSFTYASSKAAQAPSGGGTAVSLNHFNPPAAADQKVTFQVTGLTGALTGDNAQPFYSLWVDPQYPLPATVGGAAPQTAYIRVQITYQDGSIADGGTGQTIYQLYDGFSLSNNPGYVNGISVQNGAVIGHPEPVGAPYTPGVQPLLSKLTNATVTVEIWARDGNNAKDGDGNPIPIRLRTDAVAQQGRVSFLDLPYDFSKIGGASVNSLVLATPPVVS